VKIRFIYMEKDLDNKEKEDQAKVVSGEFAGSAPDIDRLITSIYNKHNQRLHQYLKSHLTSAEDVDDVSQEVYLRLSRHKAPHTLKPSFALLRKIATNIIMDLFRTRHARKADAHVPIHGLKLASPAPSPEDVVSSREGLAILTKIFESLKPNSRKAFLLHRLEGLKYSEIAEEMGISKAMVQKHISHVLLQLEKKLRLQRIKEDEL